MNLIVINATVRVNKCICGFKYFLVMNIDDQGGLKRVTQSRKKA